MTTESLAPAVNSSSSAIGSCFFKRYRQLLQTPSTSPGTDTKHLAPVSKACATFTVAALAPRAEGSAAVAWLALVTPRDGMIAWRWRPQPRQRRYCGLTGVLRSVGAGTARRGRQRASLRLHRPERVARRCGPDGWRVRPHHRPCRRTKPATAVAHEPTQNSRLPAAVSRGPHVVAIRSRCCRRAAPSACTLTRPAITWSSTSRSRS